MKTALMLLLILFTGCRDRSPMVHRAFIWNRVWSEQVSESIQKSASYISSYRILTFQIDPSGTVIAPNIDGAFLAKSSSPLIAVIRISDGASDEAWKLMPGLITHLRAPHFPKWKGIEIDFDCPTSKLKHYRTELNKIEKTLPESWSLTITALPSWIGSKELPRLTASVDSVTLQVHSVDNPSQGLFDPVKADRWVEQFSRVTRSPFTIALPCYGSAVYSDDQNAVVGVESESNRSDLWNYSRKVISSDPTQLTTFISLQQIKKVRHCTGFIWFRLPIKSDRRNWSLETLEQVITQSDRNRK